MNHNKLVRDKIPELIKKNGEKPITYLASEEEYASKLIEKLQEEVAEFIESEEEKEIVDILEVLDAIVENKNFSKANIKKLKEKKLEERGGFSKGIILDRVRK